MKSNLEIAQEAMANLKPLEEVAAKLGLTNDDIEFHGKDVVKIALSPERRKEIMSQPEGKYVLVTAISPTPAGEGKTTTSIGLTQGLNRLGKKAVVTLRQPSLGPVFGIKGGATGAGFSQVLPMEKINLGFTGDFNKVESAHNLLSAMLDNHLFRKNKLDFDMGAIQWSRVMDMNDRALRQVILGAGDNSTNGLTRLSGFDITAASEIMALFALAKDLPDLKARLGRLVLGRNKKGEVITAAQINAPGAMTALLRDAMKPNLVQTIEGDPCIMHAGPFGNIAHGCSSVIGDHLAIHMSDYVITEAGFGSDLGAEKFFDIKCRTSGMFPDAAVVVATIKALKFHGSNAPFDREKLKEENIELLKAGLPNLEKHIENMQAFGVPVIVALNKFPTDTDAEIEAVREYVNNIGAAFEVSLGVAEGGEGAKPLAQLLIDTIEKNGPVTPQFIYEDDDEIEVKIEKISKTIYGADGVVITPKAQGIINQLKKDGYSNLPICMAKTHLSLTDDPTVRGKPSGFKITISDCRISAGAGFIYPITGKMLTMPGLPPIPSAENIDVDEDGKITGLF